MRTIAIIFFLIGLIALPSVADALEPPVERIADEAAQSVGSLLLKASPAVPGKPSGRRLDLSFTVLDGGLIPRIPTCGQPLHAQFDEQMGRLGSAIGIDVNLAAPIDQAAANVVVGDTRQLMEPLDRPNPFDTHWRKIAARLGSAAKTRGVNLGLYDVFSVNWVEGLYDRVSGELVYGRIWIHWWGVSLDGVGSLEQCRANFVEHVLWLFVADLQDRFREQLYAMKQEWIRRAGIDADRDHAAKHEIERLLLASLMCAQFVAITESSSFSRCSRQVTDLVTSMPL
ncbi:hypothetical protein BH11PSE3_BH11PSE3_24960 [soil metagenome]